MESDNSFHMSFFNKKFFFFFLYDFPNDFLLFSFAIYRFSSFSCVSSFIIFT